jgi:predicted Zn-dependent protease
MSVGAVPLPVYIPRMGPKYTVPPQVMEVNLDLIMNKEQSVKYACLQNIVTHELGHALGMLGHSPNQADVMYPVTDEHSRLSQRDINTVIKLYNSKCDIPL